MADRSGSAIQGGFPDRPCAGTRPGARRDVPAALSPPAAARTETETAVATDTPAQPTTPEPPTPLLATAVSGGHRKHRFLVGSLFAVALVTGLAAAFAVWTNRQALNTSNWTTTSGHLLDAIPSNQQAVGADLVDQLFQRQRGGRDQGTSSSGIGLPARPPRGAAPGRRPGRAELARRSASRQPGSRPTAWPTRSCCASSTAATRSSRPEMARSPWISTRS